MKLISIDALSSKGQVEDLIWQDEFNSGKLDSSKWKIETGTGVNGDWGTGQLDRATDRVENISFEDSITGAEEGCLVITTRKEKYIDRSYTSGRINTSGKASWGPGHRIAARIKPEDVKYQGQGFAFWTMPAEIPTGYDYIMWPQAGEIDIMEYIGSIPFNNLETIHYALFWENNQYHDWNHGHLGAYYNYENQQVPEPEEPGYGNFPPEKNDPFEHEMYIILSAGVGGSQNTYGGSIVDEAEFPCSVFIDWVRIYKLNENSSGIKSNDKSSRLKMYPNPVSNFLNVKIDNISDYTITITNILGKKVYKRKLDNSSKINISELNSGIYIASVSDGKLTMSKKIVKN